MKVIAARFDGWTEVRKQSIAVMMEQSAAQPGECMHKSLASVSAYYFNSGGAVNQSKQPAELNACCICRARRKLPLAAIF